MTTSFTPGDLGVATVDNAPHEGQRYSIASEEGIKEALPKNFWT
jgi:hypothetical protein